MKELLREPLVQFVVIGGFLVASWSLLRPEGQDSDSQIVLTPAQIEQFSASFRMTWQRPPTESELAGVIQDWLKEEIYYREALALGFDRDDQVVRRRLRQKMEFLTDDVATAVEPTTAELEAFLAQNPERFREEPRFTFQHAYFSVDRRGAAAEEDARAVLSASDGTIDPMAVGDPFVLPLAFQDLTLTQVASTFGGEFAEALDQVERGPWQGPIPSGYGLHLVQVVERVEGGLPALPQVRDEVRRELLAQRRDETEEAVYQSLRERYTVDIQWPEGMEPLDVESEGR